MFDHEGFQGSPEPPRPTLFQRLKSVVSSHLDSKATNSASAGALEPKERYNDLVIQDIRRVIGAIFTIMVAAGAYLMSHDLSVVVALRNIDFSSLTFSATTLVTFLEYWNSFAILISAGAIPICILSILLFNCKLRQHKRRSENEEDQYKFVVAQERAIAQTEAMARVDKDKADADAAKARAQRELAEEQKAKAATKTQEALAVLLESLNNAAVPSFTDAAQSISGAAQAFGDYYKLKTEQLKANSVKAKAEAEKAAEVKATND